MLELDLDRMEALAAAVAEGTFDGAARRLHVTPSAISQRVKALETSVGRVLLVRSKPVRPTPSGSVVLRAARQMHAVRADLERDLDVAPAGGRSVIALAINADSLATWLLPALSGAGDGYVFDVRREDQERTARLLREGAVMAAVTASRDPVPGCTVEPLGRMRYRARATPAFKARWFADGLTAQSLSLAPVVVFDRDDRLQDEYLRRRCRRPVQPPRHYVPGSEAYVSAVLLGLGWGMVPDLQAGTHRGALVELGSRGHVDVDLYWQQWRLRSDGLDQLAVAVRGAAAASLTPPVAVPPRRPPGALTPA
jgi:LysR family transcriptional regulator, chromosome initiation inhibitor